MKWLIHLYPKKWKKRYGDEFLYILENGTLSVKEIIDVFINAMDARFLNLGNTPSILEISPKLLLLIGIGLGLFIGYVVGIARGIMRVVNVTQKENVFLPTGKLMFDKSKS